MSHLERDDTRRQAPPLPRQPRDQPAAVGPVVEQQAGVAPSRVEIRLQHRLDPQSRVGHARIGVGHRAGGTHGRAAAAAHAEERLDADVIALRADRPRRADVDAAGAAGDLVARVGADALLVREEARLLELADEPRELAGGERLLDGVAARREIPLRRLGHGEQRLRREVEHQVEAVAAGAVGALEIDCTHLAAGLHACPMRAAAVEVDLERKIDRPFRARTDARAAAGARVEVDRVGLLPAGLEGAEVALELNRGARVDRVAPLHRQLSRPAARRDQHRHVELVHQALGPGERRVALPHDEELASGLVRDRGHRLRFGQRCQCEQGGHLGCGRLAFLRPPRVLPQVDEGEPAPPLEGGVKFAKERRLLRAGDHHVLARLDRRLEGHDVAAAELAAHVGHAPEPERSRDRPGVQRRGAVAVAQQVGLRCAAHVGGNGGFR